MFDRHHRYAHRHFADRTPGHRLYRHVAWGGTLVAVGLALLLERRGVLDASAAWLAVPAVFAWSGLALIAFERSASSVVRGVLRIAIAAYLYVVIEHVGNWTFAATWPVLVMAAGAASIARALLERRGTTGGSAAQ